MECTQVLLSESFGVNNAVTEKSPVGTLMINGEYHTIFNTENVIGRENSCDVVISNSAVSSKHAVIEAEDSNAHLIYDLGSTNKTKLGKMVLKPHVRYHINDGDYVTFGNVSALYNISRKCSTTPVKGNATSNSCSIPETPERLASTLELASSANSKEKVSSSILELSDTDLFDEKEADTNLYLKENPNCSSKADSDIYELDTLTFDENYENGVRQTTTDDANKISVIPAKNNVEVGGNVQEIVDDEKHMPKGLPILQDKVKKNFSWEDFPEITSPVGLDPSSTDNLSCPKSKISSSFLDITNDDDLKSDQDILKNIGGVILSDLCKPSGVDSVMMDLNTHDISSSSKERESERIDKTEKELCSEKTSIESKNAYSCDVKIGQYSENDCYIPMSQNIDMFEEIPEKTMDEYPEKGDVYEMLTQVNIDNKEVDNSIYDIQTQVAIAADDPEFKVDKENDSSFLSPPNTKNFSVLEPATQPYEDNNKEEKSNTSCFKVKVVDETDNNCSLSSSIYETATQPSLQNPIERLVPTNQNPLDENVDSLSLKNQNKHGKNCNLSNSILVAAPQTISEILNPVSLNVDQNDSTASAIVEVATQPCPPSRVEIFDSVAAEISNITDENESLPSTIIEGATQPCLVKGSSDVSNQSHSSKGVASKLIDAEVNNSNLSSSMFETATQPCSLDKPQLLIKETESNSSEKISTTDLSVCDWYEIATQPCQPPSENVIEKKQELHKNEITMNDDEELKNKAVQDSSFSVSMYEIATQPCQKDTFSKKTVSINETTLNSDITTIIDESNKNNSFSASISEIATQPCPKNIVPEKTVSTNDAILNSELTLMNNENNKDSSFSASICEIATQPCSLAAKDTTDGYELIKNDENISDLNERELINDEKLNLKETKALQAENEIKKTIDPKVDIENILTSEIIHEMDTNLAETNSKISDKSFKVVKESLNDSVEGECIDILSVDKTKNLLISESVMKETETIPMVDVTISNSFFEIATQPAPCQVDLNLHDENLTLISKVSETSCKVEKVTQDKTEVALEEAKNIQDTHKSNDITLTTNLPNTLSDSFFEAATQPYKNNQGADRTFPDPLTSICNDLSDDKIGEITDELMYGNISAKLEDKNKIPCNNISNKECIELGNKIETSDHNIYEAVAHQVSLCSQKNMLPGKVNFEDAPEKITTQDLQRILESDDLTQKYDEFKKTSAMSTVSDHTLNSELDLLKNNVNSMKDKTQNIDNSDISKKITTTGEKTHNDEMARLLSDSESKSSQAQNSHCFVKDTQNVVLDDGSEGLSKAGNKICDESVPDAKAPSSKVMFLDSDSSQELIIRSNNKRSGVFPSDSQSFTNKFLDNDDSTQELIIRSNKKRSGVFPSDSLTFTNKFLDNDDSTQELIIRSNKKRSVFPPDSQSFTNKFLDNDDSSQELIIRSHKKRSSVFPSDSQSCTGRFLENDGSSQELNIRSNKKLLRVFPSDSQSFKNMFLKNDDSPQEQSIESNKKCSSVFPTLSNVSEEECVKTQDIKSYLDNTKSSDFINNEITKDNDIKKPNNHNGSSNIISNASVENNDHLGVEQETLGSDNKISPATNQQAKVLKGKLCERISTSGKRNNKETKNKSPTERERESTFISRGNITLHSPEVLSELEEQFRLTKVAMSPTQLSVVSDIDDEIISSQEVNELDKQGIRRSIRNRKNTLSIKSLENSKSPVSHLMVESASVTSNENLSKENEKKRKETNSFSTTSKNKKSFKKFKKVSPVKNSSPTKEKILDVATNEADTEIVINNTDNSQNSEELGRGKRKRIRPSYEGFIIEEDKKRSPRKKLSFSSSEDSENINNAVATIEQTNKNVLDDVPSNNSIKQTVSVVLHDIQKVSTKITDAVVKNKSTFTKKKAGSLSKTNETSLDLINNKSNLPSSSIKDEAKVKQNETSSKDKNCSFSFSEKLDELFNIWGPADRVKLSPRVAKKSYKLLADGKMESASPTTNAKKSNAVNVLDKEPKPSTSKSNKNSFKSNEKKNEPTSVEGTSSVSSNRKRNLPQKNEVFEVSDDLSKQNKKRRKTNSENSETSQEPDKDSEVRKSSRITRKKIVDIPIPDSKTEGNFTQIKRTSNELAKRVSKRSSESVEDSASVSNKNTKESLRNSSNTSMKPPLNTVIVTVRNKSLKTKEKKNLSNTKENHLQETHEENYCFSQEYSFHENKIERGKKSVDNSSNPPLQIRRSGRKKNEKTTEKNVESVMFTGFADKKTKSLVSVLGGQIVESPFTCSVLVTDKIRRTTKFLSALSRGLPIVSPQWLIDSNENGRFLDSNDFLLSDQEAETMFSFNLKKSIEKAQNRKVLDGWAIYVTPSVKPSPEEMKSIIECSGGRFLSKELIRWPANSLIVSCKEDCAMWPKFSKKGKAPIVVDNEAILLGVLRQELDLESHKLL